jgi:hypothetical protein
MCRYPDTAMIEVDILSKVIVVGRSGRVLLRHCVTALEVPSSRSPTTIPGLPSARLGASSVPPGPCVFPGIRPPKFPGRAKKSPTNVPTQNKREDHQLACYTRVLVAACQRGLPRGPATEAGFRSRRALRRSARSARFAACPTEFITRQSYCPQVAALARLLNPLDPPCAVGGQDATGGRCHTEIEVPDMRIPPTMSG